MGRAGIRMNEFSEFHIKRQLGPVNKEKLPEIFNVGRFHIVVIAALGMFTFGWLFTGRYLWLLTGICALDWFIVNLINRATDIKEDVASDIRGTKLIERYKLTVVGFGIFLLITSLIAYHFVNPAVTGLRIAGHLLGIFYNWPLLPGRRRLKELYFFKNASSGAGFMITVFGYPLATQHWVEIPYGFPTGITWGTVIFSAIFFFLFIQSYEIIYDLRDIRGDTSAGIHTYPVAHGERVAVHIVDGLIFSSMAVLMVGYLLSEVPWRIVIMAAAPLVQLFIYKRGLKRGISSKDCILLTWVGAIMLTIYHLWVVAGLPGSEG